MKRCQQVNHRTYRHGEGLGNTWGVMEKQWEGLRLWDRGGGGNLVCFILTKITVLMCGELLVGTERTHGTSEQLMTNVREEVLKPLSSLLSLWLLCSSMSTAEL